MSKEELLEKLYDEIASLIDRGETADANYIAGIVEKLEDKKA